MVGAPSLIETQSHGGQDQKGQSGCQLSVTKIYRLLPAFPSRSLFVLVPLLFRGLKLIFTGTCPGVV
uniref:Uncharacterized protein n=1 Tax=Steinernema glaseri TaxID=37863 RepID=A0A1I8AVB8_9BILA